MNRERETEEGQFEGKVVEKVTKEGGRKVVVVISIPPDGEPGEVVNVIRDKRPQLVLGNKK